MSNDSLLMDFVHKYERDFETYSRIAKIAENECRKALTTGGIPAIITSRAKGPERLLAKLRSRALEKHYKTEDDIREDLVDLVGVRIALYFPNQEESVPGLLWNIFSKPEIKRINPGPVTSTELSSSLPSQRQQEGQGEESTFVPTPYRAQFAGYRATHVRAKFGESLLVAGMDTHFANCHIEIQVASLLMHAWSEVNHDLAYKTLQGTLSEGEVRMLDGINGLVRTGEVMLNQLKSSTERRIASQKRAFANFFELGAFVQQYAPYISAAPGAAPGQRYRMGSLSALFEFVRHLKIQSPRDLSDYLERWKRDPANLTRYPIAESIMDYILAELDEKGASSSLFLRADLNERFNLVTGSSQEISIRCHILARAAAVLEDDPEKSVVFPASYYSLKSKKLLDIKQNVAISDADLEQARGMALDLWMWFQRNDTAAVRVALGMGQVKEGNRLIFKKY